MQVTRRELIKIGLGTAALGAAGYFSQGHLPGLTTGEAVSLEAGVETISPTVCGLCPSGCGLNVRVVDGRAVKVEGNPLHPVNQGVCCPRGQASLEVLYSPERLPGPMRRKIPRGKPANAFSDWERISWDEALALAGGKLRELRDAGQPHSLAVIHGETRGQVRPLLQRWMEAFGSPNLISAEAADVQAARLAMLLTQGINGLPVYDLENCRYLIAFGGSPLEAGRSVMRTIAGISTMRRGQPNRAKLVVVDPRLNVSAGKADEWIPIRPGTLGALALGMAYVIIKAGSYDAGFVRDWTFGFEDFTDDEGQAHLGFKSMVLEEYTLDRVEAITGVPGGTIARLAGEFASNRPALAMLPTGRGLASSLGGMREAMAVYALNALVGSIETPGGVQVQRYPQAAPWPALPADPVAEQGRGMARIDGAGSADSPLALSMYPQLAGQIERDQPYPIRALVLYRANPAYDFPMPEFSRALAQVPFVASLSPVLDESAAYADLILPEATFFEALQDDLVEGTGYPGVALAQPVVHPVRDARSAADIFLGLARAVGGPVAQAMPWASAEEMLAFRYSHLDISWADLKTKGVWSGLVYTFAGRGSRAWDQVVGRDRLAAPRDGRFDFFSRELYAARGPQSKDHGCLPGFYPLPDSNDEFPFLLISQEPMTCVHNWPGIAPTLEEIYGVQTRVRWDAWIEIGPAAARARGIADGDWVQVESRNGSLRARARVYPGLWPNAVHIPQGQGHLTRIAWGRTPEKEPRTIGVNPTELVDTISTDVLSGLLISGPQRVNIRKVVIR